MSDAHQPLHVLFVTTSYPIVSGSASGIFVARLVEHMARDVEATVITPAGTDPFVPGGNATVRVRPFRYAPRVWQILAQRPGGIPVALTTYRWTILLVPSLLLAMAWSVWRASRHADLIHANWAVCGFVAGIVGFLRRLPVVTTLRGEDITRAQRKRPDALLLAWCVRVSTRVVVVSEAFESWLHARFPSVRHKISLLANGVEEEFVRAGKQRQVRDGARLHLVTVGSLIRRKAVDHILRAIAGLVERSRVHLTIIGDGPEEASLQNLTTALGLGKQVVFYGAAAPEQVVELLLAADAFVLASASEGRPNAVLEAMATGLPVIASDIDGVRELIRDGHTGMLFPHGDVSVLTRKLQLLLEDPALYQRLGRTAHDFILTSGLLWPRTAERYRALYLTLLQR